MKFIYAKFIKPFPISKLRVPCYNSAFLKYFLTTAIHTEDVLSLLSVPVQKILERIEMTFTLHHTFKLQMCVGK